MFKNNNIKFTQHFFSPLSKFQRLYLIVYATKCVLYLSNLFSSSDIPDFLKEDYIHWRNLKGNKKKSIKLEILDTHHLVYSGQHESQKWVLPGRKALIWIMHTFHNKKLALGRQQFNNASTRLCSGIGK